MGKIWSQSVTLTAVLWKSVFACLCSLLHYWLGRCLNIKPDRRAYSTGNSRVQRPFAGVNYFQYVFGKWEKIFFFFFGNGVGYLERHRLWWNLMFRNSCSLTLFFPLAVCVPSVCHFLELCQSPEGGFGGGPGQYPHLAPTYAAVNALCIIGTEEAYDIINRYSQSQQWWKPRRAPFLLTLHWPLPSPACLPFVSQREASSVFVLAKATWWLFSHARWRWGGCEVSVVFFRLLHQ